MSRCILSGRRFCQQSWKIPAVGRVHSRTFQHVRLADNQKSLISPLNWNFCRLMSENSKKSEGGEEPGTKQEGQMSQESEQDLSKKTGRQRLSLVFAKYGVTAVVFHTAISLTSLGLAYLAVSRLVAASLLLDSY